MICSCCHSDGGRNSHESVSWQFLIPVYKVFTPQFWLNFQLPLSNYYRRWFNSCNYSGSCCAWDCSRGKAVEPEDRWVCGAVGFFFLARLWFICMYMEGSPLSRITLYSFILPDLLNVCFGACPALLPVHLRVFFLSFERHYYTLPFYSDLKTNSLLNDYLCVLNHYKRANTTWWSVWLGGFHL